MQKIIICDDEITIRNGLKALVEGRYPKLTISGLATNGFEAFQLIIDHQPDVALMDINMPGLSGLEVMEKAQGYSPNTRFIIISGYDEFHYAQRAIRLKAFDYLLKPLDREKLFETINRALNDAFQEDITGARNTSDKELPLGTDAVQYIFRKFKDPELCLSGLSESLHVSSSYLSRVIRKETGMSFSELLTKVRMETALSLLQSHPEMSTLKVSEETGYRNQHYFCKVFRQYTGQTPTEYRASLKKCSSREG